MRIRFSCPPHLEDLLPPPQPARRSLPHWLNAMPLIQDIAEFGPERTVKNCPPFLDAMCHGFILLLPTDISVDNGRFEWDWPAPEAPISFHFATQLPGSPFDRDGDSIIKFNNYWNITTEDGWSMLFTHPMNRPDLPFRTLSGLVDTDRFNQLPVNFPAAWIDRGFSGVLPRGTPVAQCVPLMLEDIEIAIEPMDEATNVGRDRMKAETRRERNYYRDRLRRARPAINVVGRRGPRPGS